MIPHYQDRDVTLWHSDCIELLRADELGYDRHLGYAPPLIADNSVDAVACDPPYGLVFMGKAWDDHVDNRGFGAWCEQWSRECLRVLKPGGHMVAFGGSRTWHRLACAVEDAGFEIRDSIAWLYGSGFPKSLDVSKAIDKRATENAETKRRITLVAEVIRSHRETKGMERAAVSLAVVGTASGACWNWEHQQLPSVEMWPAIKAVLDIPDEFDGLIEGDRAQFIAAERAVIGQRTTGIGTGKGAVAYIADSDNRDLTAPATDDARTWAGWGTALKPAFEPIVVGRKPLAGTVAANVLAHGTGALNVDACRVASDGSHKVTGTVTKRTTVSGDERTGRALGMYGAGSTFTPTNHDAGRWPANVALDDSQAAELGTEARFFPTFPSAPRCMLSVCGNMSVSTAAQRLSTTPAPAAGSAQGPATTSSDASTVRAAGSAVDLCDSCATAIARSLAPTQHGHSATLALGLPSTADFSERILTRSLAHIAADLGSSGTTSTMADWMTSLGCAADAINAYTTRASRLATRRSAPSDPSSDLPRWKYEAKAPTAERPRYSKVGSGNGRQNYGGYKVKQCDQCGARPSDTRTDPSCHDSWSWQEPIEREADTVAHPTVKPLDLMRWLVRLVTPPGGVVLEPFAGSGTTAEACVLEGFRCIAIEREADYLPLIVQRLSKPLQVGLDIDFGEASA